MLKMSGDEVMDFVRQAFPQHPSLAQIEELREGFVKVRVPVTERNLRPGGTVSGPTLMAIADTGMYYLVLAMVGPVALALTTNLNIDFLRAPKPADVIAETEMLKLGRRLAVGRVTIYSDGSDAPVAHATVTYSIPPETKRRQAPSE
ncbi:MAG: PaaI family thioesterase [Polyangiales bacterium]|jgi:uncharacterized protein (TIGR00369 family)